MRQSPGLPSWRVSCRGGGDGSASDHPPAPGGPGSAATRPSASHCEDFGGGSSIGGKIWRERC